MKITAIIPETPEQPKRFLIEATVEELDAVRGAAGTSQVADRYKVGYELKPAETFRATADFKKNLDKLRGLPREIQKIADVAQAAVAILEEK